MYKICFYAPASHVESIKNAMFKADAGKIGSYSQCAWQILGEGQFMPLENAQAFLGKKNKLEKLAEYKIEMVCAKNYISDVINALKHAHPYEEPAYQYWQIES